MNPKQNIDKVNPEFDPNSPSEPGNAEILQLSSEYIQEGGTLKHEPLRLEGVERFDQPPPDRFTAPECRQVIHKYADHYGLTRPQAIHSVTYFCQTGGCVKSFPNKKLNINRLREEELDVLRSICAETRPQGTVRQLARGMAYTIFRVAMEYGYPGHLYKQLKQYVPELTIMDSYQACEFYTGQRFTVPAIEKALAARALGRRTKSLGNGKRKKKKR